MARNTYTLDGIGLTNLEAGWFLEKNTGLRIIPAKRMPNISYPGADGDVFTPGGSFLPGGVRIVMYVEGADHEEFMYRVEYLNALFLQRHKLLELRHDYDVDGYVSRHAFIKVTSATEVQAIGTGMRAGKIEYFAEIPGVFWRSAVETTQLLNVGTTPSTVLVPSLTEGNAPVADALIRFKGGFSSMVLEDYTTKSKLTVNTALSASEYIIVDTANWTARKVTTNTWEGGTNVDMSVVSNRGMGSMFVMETSLFGNDFPYRVTHYCTNPSGTPTVEIRAKKSYL